MAIFNAFSEISVPKTLAFGNLLFKARAIQPLPVPTSRIEQFSGRLLFKTH
jgi:hypothetical protein